MPVFGHAGNILHSCGIQHQQEKDVIRYVPLARNAERTGGAEAKSPIVVRMSDYNDERTTGVFELRVSGFDEFGAHALALILRKDGHRCQTRARELANLRRAV